MTLLTAMLLFQEPCTFDGETAESLVNKLHKETGVAFTYGTKDKLNTYRIHYVASRSPQTREEWLEVGTLALKSAGLACVEETAAGQRVIRVTANPPPRTLRVDIALLKLTPSGGAAKVAAEFDALAKIEEARTGLLRAGVAGQGWLLSGEGWERARVDLNAEAGIYGVCMATAAFDDKTVLISSLSVERASKTGGEPVTHLSTAAVTVKRGEWRIVGAFSASETEQVAVLVKADLER